MRFWSFPLAFFVLLGCTDANKREREACAVYQTFYEYWPVEARQQFRVVRQSLPYNTQGQRPVNSFEPGVFRDPDNMHPPEFVEDTSAYFDQLQSEPSVVSDCFREGGFVFVDESEDLSALLDADGEIGWILTLSPVAIASDGRHALMRAMFYCGMLCAEEHFILFERQDSEWILKGNRRGMVS